MWWLFALVTAFVLGWSLVRDWLWQRRCDRAWEESCQSLMERAWLWTGPDGRQEWMVDWRPEDSAWILQDPRSRRGEEQR